MSFSIFGTIAALCLLAPNLLLIVAPPQSGDPLSFSADRFTTALERVGQVSCIALSVATGPQAAATSADFLAASAVVLLLVVYAALWTRYLATGRRTHTLFAPAFNVPVPMAIVPVLVFATLALWGQSWWLGLATVCFAVGHLRTSWVGFRATQ